jgi:hypothetical protein
MRTLQAHSAATTAAESWHLVYIVTGACGSVPPLHERIPTTTVYTHAAENIRDRWLSPVMESCELNAHNGEVHATQAHEASYA